MKITKVVVGIHEKRNHPHEYGHYDASVTFTADLALNDDPDGATDLLRAKARRHVLEECTDWVEATHKEQRIAESIHDFDCRIANLSWNTVTVIEACNKIIEQLPEGMRAEYHQRLIEAVNQLPQKEQAPKNDEEEIAF